MTTTITRLYSDSARAHAAVKELHDEGFDDDLITVVSNSGSTGNIVDAIVKGGVFASDAKTYAEGVRRGGTLVTVRAPWGTANMATHILDAAGPIESGVKHTTTYRQYDAPSLSADFGLPMILKEPTPFSTFWNLPLLLKDTNIWGAVSHKTQILPGTLIAKKLTPLSSLLGMAMVTKGLFLSSRK